KCFVPLADRAEVVLVYASVADGLAAFLVERGAKGLGVGEREKNMGLKALETFPVTLDGVRVPAPAPLGAAAPDPQPLPHPSRCSPPGVSEAPGRPWAWRGPRSTTRASTPRSARRSAWRSRRSRRSRSCSPTWRSRSTPFACSRGKPPGGWTRGCRPRARPSSRASTPPTRCSRSPTTRSRCWEATATSVTISWSFSCATRAASPSSTVWPSSETRRHDHDRLRAVRLHPQRAQDDPHGGRADDAAHLAALRRARAREALGLHHHDVKRVQLHAPHRHPH